MPAPAASPYAAANAAPKAAELRPPPPILTKRGADILVRVEKLLDDAAKTAGDPLKPVKPVSSSTVGFTDSFAAAVSDKPAASEKPAAPPAARKN